MKTNTLFLFLITIILPVCVTSCSKDDGDSFEGDWVDLGLPSGRLWATHNIGATNPEDYGDYFAWGETCVKNTYDEENYIYYHFDGGLDYLTKYCNDPFHGWNGFFDSITSLQMCDDAASANWGNGARTPTFTDWEELLDYCHVWRGFMNGVAGVYFKGPNGKKLFLPAAGEKARDYIYDEDDRGYYWTSTIDAFDAVWYIELNACLLCIADDAALTSALSDIRYRGFSIRPVR